MKPADASEKDLESTIVASLVEDAGYIQGATRRTTTGNVPPT